MQKKNRIARLAACAVVALSAGSAFAGTFVPEIGIGKASGKDIDLSGETTRDTFVYTVGVNYLFDNGFGAGIVAIADGDPARGLFATDRSFDNFVGVQGTGALPISDTFRLTGALGVGRTKLDVGNGGNGESSQSVTDGLLAVGLQWQPTRHYAMELRVAHLTTSSVTATSLVFQFPF